MIDHTFATTPWDEAFYTDYDGPGRNSLGMRENHEFSELKWGIQENDYYRFDLNNWTMDDYITGLNSLSRVHKLSDSAVGSFLPYIDPLTDNVSPLPVPYIYTKPALEYTFWRRIAENIDKLVSCVAGVQEGNYLSAFDDGWCDGSKTPFSSGLVGGFRFQPFGRLERSFFHHLYPFRPLSMFGPAGHCGDNTGGIYGSEDDFNVQVFSFGLSQSGASASSIHNAAKSLVILDSEVPLSGPGIRGELVGRTWTAIAFLWPARVGSTFSQQYGWNQYVSYWNYPAASNSTNLVRFRFKATVHPDSGSYGGYEVRFGLITPGMTFNQFCDVSNSAWSGYFTGLSGEPILEDDLHIGPNQVNLTVNPVSQTGSYYAMVVSPFPVYDNNHWITSMASNPNPASYYYNYPLLTGHADWSLTHVSRAYLMALPRTESWASR